MPRPTRFPELRARSLNKEPFVVPTGLEGTHNVVLVPFHRSQQAICDAWIPHLHALSDAFPGIDYYELPTLPSRSPLFRWWVDNGMRMGIRGTSARHRTITIYTDRAEFREQLDIEGDGQVHVFLLDRTGRIHWRHAGPPSPSAVKSLMARLQALVARPLTAA